MGIVIYGVALVFLLAFGACRERNRKEAELRERRRRKATQQRRYKASGMADIDAMKGLDFEHYICTLLIHRGFVARVTPATGDLGVDLVAQRDGQKYAIQVQRYLNGVSRRAVSDAVAGKQHYGCDRAMVIASSFFTEGAKKLARSTGCELIDRDLLAQWILEYQQAISAKASVPTQGTSDHDESLEISLAAGMDLPTAMAVSSCNDREPSANTGCSLIAAYVIFVGLLAWVIVGWLR